MKLKKLAAIFLSAVMAVSVTTSAFAATPTTGSITVTTKSSGRTLEAYRLFDATTDGSNHYGYMLNTKYEAALCSALNVEKGTKTDAQIGNELLGKLAEMSDDSQAAKNFALSMQNALKDERGDATLAQDAAVTAAPYKYAAEDVDLGYYIIFDKAAGSEEYAPTFAMLNSTKPDVNVQAKDSTVTSDKTVADTNTTDFQKTVGVNIGDIVTYKITGDIPAYASTGNNQYEVKLTDTLSDDLQYVEIKSVELKGDGITNPFQAGDVVFQDKDGNATSDMTKAVSFTLDKNVVDKTVDPKIDYLNDKPATITITYTAKVVSAEKIVDPNTNTFTYEYGKPGGTFTQEPKKATVYTYGFSIYKHSNEKNPVVYSTNAQTDYVPLVGAEFNLTKKDSTTPLTFTKNQDGNYIYDANGNDILVSGANGYVNIYGLDAGDYVLQETKAPAGYNLLADTINVTITAKADSDGVANGDCTVSYKPTHGTGDKTDAGNYTVDVLNITGTTLPGTGGMGTTLFTVGGLIILCAAGAFLFFNRKRIFGK